MIRYRKFQFGWVIVVTFVTILIWITFAYIYQWGNNPIDKPGYIFFIVLFGLVLLGFYGMTITVTDKQIKIKLGIGFYTKKIDLSSIKSVDTQKYPVFYGYGIRFIPNGFLYNVSGRHAIEIKFKNKSQVIKIGTNDWDNLREVIEKSMEEHR
jgi:hypothetical protein